MRELSPETVAQLQAQLERAQSQGMFSRLIHESIAEASFLVAAADGQVTALEVAQFADAVEQVFGQDMEVQPPQLLEAFRERLAREGAPGRCEAIGRTIRGTPGAELALRFAATVAFVDDQVHPAEAAILEALGNALGISEERAQQIMGAVHTELFGG